MHIPENTTNPFLYEILTIFDKYGYLKPNLLRDIKIKAEYKELRADIGSKKARELLADNYYVSTKTIEKILYNKGDELISMYKTDKSRKQPF